MASSQKLMQVELQMDAEAAIRVNKAFFDQMVGDGKSAFAELSNAQKSSLNTALGGTEKTVIDIVWNSDAKQVEQSYRTIYSALDPIEQKINQIEKIEKGSLTNLRQRINNLKQQRDEIAVNIKDVDMFGKQVDAINPKWTALNNQIKATQKELSIAGASNFWEQFKARLDLGQFLAVGKSVNEIVQTFQSVFIVLGQVQGAFNDVANALRTVQEFQLTFKAIGQGVSGANEALKESTSIALNLGADLNTVQDGFKKLAPTVLQTGGSMSDVSAITSSLASRFAVFGLNADESRRVMNGVIQAFGKGKFMAEEFTQQIAEADKAFATDFANAMGVSIGQLYKMIKAGDITVDVIRRIIPLMSKASEVQGKLGETGTSAAAALGQVGVTVNMVNNQFNTLNTINLRAFAEQFKPIIGAVFMIQGAIIDLIAVVVKLEAFKTIANTVNAFALEVAAATQFIFGLLGAFLKFIDGIFAVINGLDNLLPKINGIGVVTGILATLISGALIGSLTSLAVSTIPGAIAAVVGFAKAFLNPQIAIKAFLQGLTDLGQAIAAYGLKVQAEAAAEAEALAAKEASAGAIAESVAAKEADMAATAQLTVANKALTESELEVAAALAGVGVVTEPVIAGLEGEAVAAGEAAAANDALAASEGAAAGGMAGFGAGLLALGEIALAAGVAIGAIAVATTEWKQSFNGLDEYQKNAKQSIIDLNDALNKLKPNFNTTGGQAQAFAEKLELIRQKAEQNKNPLSQFWNFITNADATSLNAIDRAIIAVSQSDQDLTKGYNESIKVLREYNSATDEGTQKQKNAQKTLEATVSAYDNIIKQSEEYRDKLAEQASADGNLTDEERKRLETLNNGITGLKNQRQALEDAAKAKGLYINADVAQADEKEATALDLLKYKLEDLKYARDQLKEKIQMELDIKVEGLEKLKEAIKLQGEANVRSLERQRDASKALTDQIVSNLDIAKMKWENFYANSMLGIERQKAAEDIRHGRAMADIDSEMSRIESQRAAALASIEAVAARQKAANVARMSQLESENRLIQEKSSYEKDQAEREYQIKRLQREVGYSQDPRVKQDLQDQIALLEKLQRIDDERHRKEQENIAKTAAAKAAEAQTEANIAAAKAAAEANYAAQKAQAEEKRRQEELKHQEEQARIEEEKRRIESEKMKTEMEFELAKKKVVDEGKENERKYNQLIDDEKAQQQARIKKVDDQIAAAKKEAKEKEKVYDSQISSLEREIELDSRKTASNTQAINTYSEAAANAAGRMATNFGNAASNAERLKQALATMPAAPSVSGAGSNGGGSTPNPNYRGNRAMGGFMAAGTIATVNELGREAFLGSSGLLSWINAPSWGLWTAPESGVVIPHNLTAGLNIPNGGIDINTRSISGFSVGSVSSSGMAGGRITNNVTIQSTKPVQDASRMMIEMSKMRTRFR